ncbi:MAG: SIR2 family protein [Thermoanaerobaculia bacterium]
MSLADIQAIPAIPEGLREAAAIGYLRPFVGAGASRLAGCPDWSGFADRCLQFFVERGKLNHAEVELLKRKGAKIKLAIATALAREHSTPIDFQAILHPKDWEKNEKGIRLYRALSRLSRNFVTTNYDRWLDEDREYRGDFEPEAAMNSAPQRLKRRMVSKPSLILPDDLRQPDTVVHLHGSIEFPEEMVLTTRDYLDHYANDRFVRTSQDENRILTFLEHLFSQYSVLFVGYGFDELEVLEYVVQKARHRSEAGRAQRHYMLQGYFTHELAMMRRLRTYYREECGIELVPFALDGRGYDQLIDVLEAFAKEIPAATPLVMQEKLEMRALLEAEP